MNIILSNTSDSTNGFRQFAISFPQKNSSTKPIKTYPIEVEGKSKTQECPQKMRPKERLQEKKIVSLSSEQLQAILHDMVKETKLQLPSGILEPILKQFTPKKITPEDLIKLLDNFLFFLELQPKINAFALQLDQKKEFSIPDCLEIMGLHGKVHELVESLLQRRLTKEIVSKVQKRVFDEAKSILKNSNPAKVFEKGSQKGKTLRKVIDSIQSHSYTHVQPLLLAPHSSSGVLCNPKFCAFRKAVDKQAEERATQEALFSFTPHPQTLPTMAIDKLSLLSWNIPLLSLEEKEIALNVKDITKEAYLGILKNLSIKEHALKQLHNLPHLPQTIIITKEAFPSINDFFFYKTLYLLAKTKKIEMYALPDFSLYSKEIKEEFYRFAQRKYQLYHEDDPEGTEKKVSFQKLQNLWLNGDLTEQTYIHSTDHPDKAYTLFGPEHKKLHFFLDMPWKFITSENIASTQHLNKFLEGKPDFKLPKKISAQPYIKDVQTALELTSLQTLDSVLERLSEESEISLCYTALFQFLDFHNANLGFMPQFPEGNPPFQDCLFKLPSKKWIPFKTLITLFLQQKINRDTIVSFFSLKERNINLKHNKTLNDSKEELYQITQTPAPVRKAAIKDIPSLESTLNLPWDIIIYDTDLSLAEDSELQYFTTAEQKTFHIVPIRSALFSTPKAKQPLSLNTIQALLNPYLEDTLHTWIYESSAPILFHIKGKEDKKYVLDYVKNLASSPSYHYSSPRHLTTTPPSSLPLTHAQLKEKFANDLASLENHTDFWNRFHNILTKSSSSWKSWYTPTYTVISETDLLKLSEKHSLSIQTLQTLNPHVSNLHLNAPIPVGTKIRLKPNLNTKMGSSMGNWALSSRKKIAASLFPKMTKRQVQALKDRQENLRTYLENYQKLSSLRNNDEKYAFFVKLLNTPTTPLSSVAKRHLLHQLASYPTTKRKSIILDVEEFLQKNLVPSYLLITSAMYPLLPDTWRLTEYVIRKTQIKWPQEDLFGTVHLPLEYLIQCYLNHEGTKDPTLLTKPYFKKIHALFNSGELKITDFPTLTDQMTLDVLGEERDALFHILTVFQRKNAYSTPSASFFLNLNLEARKYEEVTQTKTPSFEKEGINPPTFQSAPATCGHFTFNKTKDSFDNSDDETDESEDDNFSELIKSILNQPKAHSPKEEDSLLEFY